MNELAEGGVDDDVLAQAPAGWLIVARDTGDACVATSCVFSVDDSGSRPASACP